MAGRDVTMVFQARYCVKLSQEEAREFLETGDMDEFIYKEFLTKRIADLCRDYPVTVSTTTQGLDSHLFRCDRRLSNREVLALIDGQESSLFSSP